MGTKSSSHHDDFSFSWQGATPPVIEAPSRFARALKHARMVRGWTQTRLAKELGIPKRAIVSWETATRLPSIGIVILLIDGLAKEGFSLSHELLLSYILDDLERKVERNDSQKAETLLSHVHHAIFQVEEISRGYSQPVPREPLLLAEVSASSRASTNQEAPSRDTASSSSWESLFSLLEQLRQHPDLIPVAHDFVRELAPTGEK